VVYPGPGPGRHMHMRSRDRDGGPLGHCHHAQHSKLLLRSVIIMIMGLEFIHYTKAEKAQCLVNAEPPSYDIYWLGNRTGQNMDHDSYFI
jgi:hypothetical protein